MRLKRIVAALGLAAASIAVIPGATAHADCTNWTRLYDGQYFTGYSYLVQTPRGQLVDLDLAGFGNRISSISVGGCPVQFWTNPNGTGSTLWVPGNGTVATLSATMNNAISSMVIG